MVLDVINCSEKVSESYFLDPEKVLWVRKKVLGFLQTFSVTPETMADLALLAQ